MYCLLEFCCHITYSIWWEYYELYYLHNCYLLKKQTSMFYCLLSTTKVLIKHDTIVIVFKWTIYIMQVKLINGLDDWHGIRCYHWVIDTFKSSKNDMHKNVI